MYELAGPSEFEQVIKKSRFLAYAIPVDSEDAAKAAITAHSHADAGHNCWAWRVGASYRFSDDGEPSGTAGKPILAAIDGQSLDKVLVIVSRWFGGILLGSGGLVRAYGGTAAACLKEADRIEVTPSVTCEVSLEFSELARIKGKLTTVDGLQIGEERFTDRGADLTLRIPEARFDAVAQMLADLTLGRVSLKPGSV